VEENLNDLEIKAKTHTQLKNLLPDIKEKIKFDIRTNPIIPLWHIVFDEFNIRFDEINTFLKIDSINTFDKPIIEAGKKPDEQVKTELDRDIFHLQKKYLDFQLNLGKKAFDIVTKHNNGHAQAAVAQLRKQHQRFIEIIDHLFKDTDKKINQEKNEIAFMGANGELSPYDLSSGEKQILVILLTTLVQDNKPAIIFMDEPEISLHFDWQKKLIQYMRELNPNAQIILATHSPALIIEGWRDKVKDVRDLITHDRLKPKT
jgi:predicted ATP-dependent endonuclease of OLD family